MARGNAERLEDCGLSAEPGTQEWTSWARETAGLASGSAIAEHGADGHQCSAACDQGSAQVAIDAAYQEVEAEGDAAPPAGSVEAGALASAPGLPEPDNAAVPGEELAVGFVEGRVGSGFPDKLGLTKPGTDLSPPKLTIRVERRRGSMGQPDYFAAFIEPTAAKDAHDSSWATPAGWFDAGPLRGNDGIDYAQKLEVTPDDAATLELAEGEHLADIAYAYEITLGAVADAINANTGDEFWGSTEAEARAHALDVVNSGLPVPLQARFPDAIGLQAILARSRLVQENPRDQNHWHDAHILPQDGDAVDLKRRTIKMRLVTPKGIGVVPSSALFKV